MSESNHLLTSMISTILLSEKKNQNVFNEYSLKSVKMKSKNESRQSNVLPTLVTNCTIMSRYLHPAVVEEER